MGLIYADVSLTNPTRGDLAGIELRMLADTGATLSIIPEAVALQLELPLDHYPRRPIELADGSTRVVPYVAPLVFHFKNRISVGPALVTGDDPVLGALQMEDMDLVLLPQKRAIDVNPAHPNRPVARA